MQTLWTKLAYIVEDFDKMRRNDVILRRDNNIFKVIMTLTLNEFCFRIKTIHFQDTTKSPITKSKFRYFLFKTKGKDSKR